MSSVNKTSDIKAQIVAKRRDRIAGEGHTLGHAVPETRRHPVVPFLRDPGVICEIKRKSPSKGNIRLSMDPGDQAALYSEAGVQTVSVLTEEDYFAGSLKDLMDVKDRFPELCVLRKDFLVDTKDIDVSYRAGADAVLLIASMLTADELEKMYRHAASLGLSVLFEVHDREDISKAAAVKPDVIGINCRNLSTFTTDLAYPLKVKGELDAAGVSSSRLVFESGIFHKEEAAYAFASGFSGILVGESVVRAPGLVPLLLEAARETYTGQDFWARLYAGKGLSPGVNKPLVKICGITRREDALLAADLGADIIGCIMAESPRRVSPGFFQSIRDIDVPKVAVVVSTAPGAWVVMKEVRELLAQGLIDAVQFHGDEEPESCAPSAFPYYKALSIAKEEDVHRITRFRSPRVLIDAFSNDARGGTGKRVQSSLVDSVSKTGPLWLAGGITPDNIAEIIKAHTPELVDLSSGLERTKGVKDSSKMKQFFDTIGK